MERPGTTGELGVDAGTAAGTAGPEIFSDAPTTIGVGETRGAGVAFGFIAGIEFVTTTFTGVGVGSTPV
jgi:hypothetical protein